MEDVARAELAKRLAKIRDEATAARNAAIECGRKAATLYDLRQSNLREHERLTAAANLLDQMLSV